MSTDALAAKAAACGIAVTYRDYTGASIEPPTSTIEALIDLIGPIPEEAPVEVASCHLEDGMRSWGWAAQLYALRSRNSWGMGDLSDLSTLSRWSQERGGLVMVSPLTAGTPGATRTESPYLPSSRYFLDPIHIDVTAVPGFVDPGGVLSAMGRSLNGERQIERDAVWALKSAGLEEIWRSFHREEAPDAFVSQDPLVNRYATYCAISEVHGPDWRGWPPELRSPSNAAVDEFGRARKGRVAFHAWLQWVADHQLAKGAGGLVQDLAVGIDPAGADAWMLGDQVIVGASVGAPPDHFNTQGQDWGVTSFHPGRILASGGEAFTRTIDAAMRHAVGVRIDHVMGLFRLYLIPAGASPRDGTYVSFPHEHLLGWVAAQSQRHRCFVVGEDLGTVEPRVRQMMAERRILGFRVLLSSPDPRKYPELSVAAVTTHDLPTIAGLVTGEDLRHQRSLGLEPNVEATAKVRERFIALAGSEDPEVVALAAYKSLSESVSALVFATFQDALSMTERPNMPGTTNGWPNWRLPLSAPLEEVLSLVQVTGLVDLLSARTSGPGDQSKLGGA